MRLSFKNVNNKKIISIKNNQNLNGRTMQGNRMVIYCIVISGKITLFGGFAISGAFSKFLAGKTERLQIRD